MSFWIKKSLPREIVCEECIDLTYRRTIFDSIYASQKCKSCKGMGITPIPMNELITPDNVYKRKFNELIVKAGKYTVIFMLINI